MSIKKDYTREELIDICLKSVVHYTKWCNRDSYSAQVNIQSIYRGLTAGLDYIISDDTTDRTIWIEFESPIDIDKLNQYGEYLEISSLDDYHTDLDPEYETEMFDGSGINFHSKTYSYFGGYMPTPERLELCDGDDWY